MTLFSKIIEGQIPCYKIYEDNLVFAFLDIKPHNPGHTLLIPKQEVGDFQELPPELLQHIMTKAQDISRVLQQTFEPKRVGLVVHGMGVPDHFHLHLIPMFSPDDLNTTKAKDATPESLERFQAKILSNI